MAQPVFDGHPLEEYFEDTGETSQFIPGGIADASFQPYLTDRPSISKHAERMEKLCFLIFNTLQSLCLFFSPDRSSLRTQAFAERFKYGVISSSLLSSAFAAPPVVESHKRTSSLPGNLHHGHSRTPSAAESTLTDTLSLSMPPEPETPVWPLSLSFTIAIAAFSARFYFFAFLLLAGTLYYIRIHKVDTHSKPDVMTPSLLALQHLISAGHLWDTVINDTFTILENEERSIFYGPTTPHTPSSSLRVALSTSLLTTQTQCDNVRQLLSAITSPPELAQLSEMYAPPSPIKPTFSRSDRPLSHPGPSLPRGTPITDRMKKRFTWNGSYASLALAGTPPGCQLTQRREKRRSDLSALIGTTTTPSPARTRLSPPQLLTDVSEEEDGDGDGEGMVTASSSLLAEDDIENSFGAAALDLYRTRLSGGLRALELSRRGTPTRGARPSTLSPGSKYTSMHTTRHPFSLSSLRRSLQNALASKRFACSHLLALRFEDDDDEVYWEDVRAVMSLLTSTLVDASSRLSEALDHAEEQHLKADNECASPGSPPSSPPPRRHPSLSHAIEEMVSFAPTPSHLARFAAHVGAISMALDDARDQLERCLACLGLKDDRPGHSSHPSTSTSTSASTSTSISSSSDVPPGFGETGEHPAVTAYERVRRELGIALRECERGRERLGCVLSPPTPSTEDDDTPAPVAFPPKAQEGADVSEGAGGAGGAEVRKGVEGVMGDDDDGRVRSGDERDGDDATTHLLLSTSPTHLPPPGLEHVYEAETEPERIPVRERSKLPRVDRIRLARAKRDAPLPPSPPVQNRWGPTDDVVQELKDVIWKVGQRRRPVT